MKYSKEFKVGLFAIIAIVSLYMGFNYLKGSDFLSSTNNYYVVYSNIGGLEVSNPVKINGVNVGRVSAKRLMQSKEKNEVVVEIDMDGDIILGEGATATLNSDFLGNISIEVDNGDLSSPIAINDTITGKLAKGIEELLKESALPMANNLEATIQKINAILDAFTGNGEKIQHMLDNMETSSTQLKYMLKETRGHMGELSKNYNQLAITMNTTAKGAQPLMKKYGALADSLKAIDFQTTLYKLNATMDSLTLTVTKLNNGTGTMGKLLNNDSMYVNLNHSLENLDKLLIHMNEEPDHFFAPLGKSKKQIEKQRKKEARKAN